MRKKRSILSVMASLLLALSLLSGNVLAAEGGEPGSGFLPGMTVDGTLLINGDASYSEDYGLVPYGDYLANGGCSVTRLSDTMAEVYGFTSCYRESDYVYLGLYLDRLEDNGSWHTIWYKELTAENTAFLDYTINVLVKKGYFYRMRAGHIATKGNIMESNTSFTDGLGFGISNNADGN